MSAFYGAPPAARYVSGNWYPAVLNSFLPAAGATITNAITRLYPFQVRHAVSVTDLGARVTTISAAGNFRVGIYANDPATNKATVCLGSVGGLSTGTAAVVSGTLASAVSLSPGAYWGALQCDNSTAVFQALSTAYGAVSVLLGDAALATANPTATTGLSCTGAAVGYAAGMTDFSAVAQTAVAANGFALLWFKAG